MSCKGLLIALGALALVPTLVRADTAGLQLAIARDMIRPVKQKLREEYYDASFTGIDFEGIFRTAEQQLAAAKTPNEAYAVIAQAVVNLGDSHSSFIPPPRPALVRYGWALQIVGQNVFVQAVQPGSDAAKQGVRAGERVLSINGLPATRDSLHLLRYLFRVLNPQGELRVQLQAADGAPREVAFAAEVRRLANNLSAQSGDWMKLVLESEAEQIKRRSHFQDLAPGVLYWRLGSFGDDDDVVAGLHKSKGYGQVILDLRGNPGGLEETMLDAIGAFLGSKTEIGTLRQRDRTEKLVASSLLALKARLYVLIDGGSYSAAELFARTMQLEGRAVVLGDRSGGFVNQGRQYPLTSGPGDRLVLFGVSVTTGAITMKDGQPLEKVGVTPDVWLVPSPKDLAAGNDPVLATAAKMAGVTLTKAAAGEISRENRQAVFD